jgi:hypothetical protein
MNSGATAQIATHNETINTAAARCNDCTITRVIDGIREVSFCGLTKIESLAPVMLRLDAQQPA